MTGKRKNTRRRRLLTGLLLLLVGWGGWAALTARSAYQHLQAARQTLSGPLSSAAVDEGCREITLAGADLALVRRLTSPVAPLLRRLGGLPRYGPTLATAPAALDLGTAGASFASELCTLARPVLPAFDQQDQRLGAAINLLLASEVDLDLLRPHADALVASWQALPPAALERGLLQPFAEQLQRAEPALLALPAAIATADRLLPALPTLLGTDHEQQILVLGQNPFELRATGGFIGSLGALTIAQGKVTQITYGNSADYAVVAPADWQMPLPYARYLRASRWYLRDALWWADFPTSADRLDAFWQLHGHPPADGVVAVDLFALQALVKALGGIDVPGYGHLPGENTIEAIFASYEAREGRRTTDKVFLSAVFQGMLSELEQVPAAELPTVLATLGQSLDERHISIWLRDSHAASALRQQRWDGALRAEAGDYLQVVDADLSYSDVQAFIDERIAYQIELDDDLAPLTATVTVTISNRYDPWLAAQTHERIYGNCYNLGTGLLERVPGCYGDYLRFYMPGSAAVLSLTGTDGPPEPDTEAGRGVLGSYLMLYPGQTRTVRLTYRHYGLNGTPYRLTLQKQAGTLARPIDVAIRNNDQQLLLRTDLWTDRQIVLGWEDGQLALAQPLGPRHPHNTDRELAAPAAFDLGRQRWLRGDREGALARWRESDTLPQAIDWARALVWDGQQAQSRELAAALAQESPIAARAAYLEGELAVHAGDPAAAEAAYRRSAELDPANYAPRLALALLYHARGDTERAAEELALIGDAATLLRQIAELQQQNGETDEFRTTMALLLEIAPLDQQALSILYTAYGQEQPPNWQAMKDLTDSILAHDPNAAAWRVRRGQVLEQLEQPLDALADYEQSTTISPTYGLAWANVGRLRWSVQQDAEGALAAYAETREHAPQIHNGYTGAAGILLSQQRANEAEQLLREGIANAPDQPFIWYMLATRILLPGQRANEAVSVLTTAIEAGGNTSIYHTALGDALLALGRTDEARDAYNRALEINPGDAGALNGLEQLGG